MAIACVALVGSWAGRNLTKQRNATDQCWESIMRRCSTNTTQSQSTGQNPGRYFHGRWTSFAASWRSLPVRCAVKAVRWLSSEFGRAQPSSSARARASLYCSPIVKKHWEGTGWNGGGVSAGLAVAYTTSSSTTKTQPRMTAAATAVVV